MHFLRDPQYRNYRIFQLIFLRCIFLQILPPPCCGINYVLQLLTTATFADPFVRSHWGKLWGPLWAQLDRQRHGCVAGMLRLRGLLGPAASPCGGHGDGRLRRHQRPSWRLVRQREDHPFRPGAWCFFLCSSWPASVPHICCRF